MTPSQKLRSIADSTGLDGIADAIREIANEIEHNNAPAVPVTCGNGCDCLAQCGDAYAHAGLPKPRQAEATSQGWPFGELSDGQIMATVGRMGELVNYLKLVHQWDGICNLVRQIIRERYTLSATPAPAPAQEVGLTPDHHARLWNEAENKAEYRAQAWLIYGQMVEKAIIAALRAKGAV